MKIPNKKKLEDKYVAHYEILFYARRERDTQTQSRYQQKLSAISYISFVHILLLKNSSKCH